MAVVTRDGAKLATLATVTGTAALADLADAGLCLGRANCLNLVLGCLVLLSDPGLGQPH
ncbi:MAG TPA: hypothetical protein VI756_31815 [Blastocatellia bacterium]